MPFNVRSTAITTAIIAFFTTASIGAFCKHRPFTCCKRGLLAMFITYVAVSFVMKIINTIVINAIITKQVDQRLGKKPK
jgi:hypothetical protein